MKTKFEIRFLFYYVLAILICYSVYFCIYNFAIHQSIKIRYTVLSWGSVYSSDATDRCNWYFVNYTPSPWENEWYHNILKFQDNVCETLSKPEHLNKSIRLIKRITILQKLGNASAIVMTKEDDELLSKIFYRQKCLDPQTNTLFIKAEVAHTMEPLVGLLRDPLSICSQKSSALVPSALYDGATLQSKRFLLLSVSAPFRMYAPQEYTASDKKSLNIRNRARNIQPWMYQRLDLSDFDIPESNRNPQVILFDLGSSYFGNWNGDSTAAAGLWFYQYYKRFDVKFDRIISFEHATLNQKKAWEQLPEDIFPIYTLINVGVSTNGTFNPWKTLMAIASRDDHVVVKLDIDTPLLETTLMMQLLTNSSIYSLIDEFFFEHHVTVKEMVPYWGYPPGTLKDSFELFRKIRQLGIRMHSWP